MADTQMSIDHNTLRIHPQSAPSKDLPLGMIGQIVIYENRRY